MTLGEYILEYRKSHKISQRKFAEMCNGQLTHTYISMLEKNERPGNKKPIIPSVQTFKIVASVTGVSFDELARIIDGDSLISIKTDPIKDESNKIIADIYSQLSPANQAIAADFLKVLLKNQ